jgi:hypothetical protein
VSRRIAIVAADGVAALHGLEGRFAWGEAWTFSPSDGEAIAAWGPETVIGLDGMPPEGPWRSIDFEAGGRRSVSTTAPGAWRRALLPAADDLMELQPHVGTGVVVAGGPEVERESVAGKLRSLSVEVHAVPCLTRDDLARAAVVALLGGSGQPPPAGATAVLAAGRVLLLPRAEPGATTFRTRTRTTWSGPRTPRRPTRRPSSRSSLSGFSRLRRTSRPPFTSDLPSTPSSRTPPELRAPRRCEERRDRRRASRPRGRPR